MWFRTFSRLCPNSRRGAKAGCQRPRQSTGWWQRGCLLCVSLYIGSRKRLIVPQRVATVQEWSSSPVLVCNWYVTSRFKLEIPSSWANVFSFFTMSCLYIFSAPVSQYYYYFLQKRINNSHFCMQREVPCSSRTVCLWNTWCQCFYVWGTIKNERGAGWGYVLIAGLFDHTTCKETGHTLGKLGSVQSSLVTKYLLIFGTWLF